MSSKNKKNSNKGTKLSKKSVAIIAAIAVIVAALGIWYFGFGPGKVVPAEPINLSEDTTKLLIPAENAISGGTTQDMKDRFEGDIAGAALTVNGEPVDAGVMQFAVNDFGMKYAKSLLITGALGDGLNFDWNAKDPNYDGTFLEYVKFWALEDFVPRYALIAEGKRRGITLTDDDKQEVKKWRKEQQKDMTDAEFEKVLKQNGCPDIETYEAFRELSVFEAKVYEDFEKNPEAYASREQLIGADERELVTVKHILIAFNSQNPSGEYTEEMKADAKKRAETILARVNSGEDFDAVAQECTNDTQIEYTLGADDDYEQSFKDAAFSIEIGGISGLVETAYGYHIIKRYERAVSISDYLILLNKNAKVTLNKSVFEKMEVTVDMKTYFDSVLKSFMG